MIKSIRNILIICFIAIALISCNHTKEKEIILTEIESIRVLLGGEYIENGGIIYEEEVFILTEALPTEWNQRWLSQGLAVTLINERDFWKLSTLNEQTEIIADWDGVNQTVVLSGIPTLEQDVIFYDLGERPMMTALNRELTYRLNGGMALPEGNGNPVVIFLHGSHFVEEAAVNRYDLGFSYLMKTLKEQEYGAISMNVGMQYSFEDGEPINSERLDEIFFHQLEAFLRANDGEKLFPIDLTGAFDFSNVILVGHSRSGQEIFRLAELLNEREDVTVKGLLAIAPSRYWVMDYDRVDVPTAIILPELDGDVESLDGQGIFDVLIESKRDAEVQLVYLYGANHNGFNQMLQRQDRGKSWYQGEIESLAQAEQREFMKQYLQFFIAAVIEEESLFTLTDSRATMVWGYRGIVSTFGSGETLYHSVDAANWLGEKVEADQMIFSYIVDENTIAPFYHPGNPERMELLRINWEESGASIFFPFENERDFSDKDFLNLYLAQDSTNDLNQQTNQSFTVSLVDRDGNEAMIILSEETPALAYQDGEPIFDGVVYSSHTPLAIISLPLTEFEGISFDKVVGVKLSFDRNQSGSILLRSILAVSLANQ